MPPKWPPVGSSGPRSGTGSVLGAVTSSTSVAPPKVAPKRPPRPGSVSMAPVDPAEGSADASAATPAVTPAVSPAVTPAVTPVVTPAAKVAPKIPPKMGAATPVVTPSTTPVATPKMAPKVGPKVAPKVGPKVAPNASPLHPPRVVEEASADAGAPLASEPSADSSSTTTEQDETDSATVAPVPESPVAEKSPVSTESPVLDHTNEATEESEDTEGSNVNDAEANQVLLTEVGGSSPQTSDPQKKKKKGLFSRGMNKLDKMLVLSGPTLDKVLAAPTKKSGSASPAVKRKFAFPEFADEQMRLATFRDKEWPGLVPLELCVASALFFDPDSAQKDRCRCFLCGAEIVAFSATSDPFDMHVEANPACDFTKIAPTKPPAVLPKEAAAPSSKPTSASKVSATSSPKPEQEESDNSADSPAEVFSPGPQPMSRKESIRMKIKQVRSSSGNIRSSLNVSELDSEESEDIELIPADVLSAVAWRRQQAQQSLRLPVSLRDLLLDRLQDETSGSLDYQETISQMIRRPEQASLSTLLQMALTDSNIADEFLFAFFFACRTLTKSIADLINTITEVVATASKEVDSSDASVVQSARRSAYARALARLRLWVRLFPSDFDRTSVLSILTKLEPSSDSKFEWDCLRLEIASHFPSLAKDLPVAPSNLGSAAGLVVAEAFPGPEVRFVDVTARCQGQASGSWSHLDLERGDVVCVLQPCGEALWRGYSLKTKTLGLFAVSQTSPLEPGGLAALGRTLGRRHADIERAKADVRELFLSLTAQDIASTLTRHEWNLFVQVSENDIAQALFGNPTIPVHQRAPGLARLVSRQWDVANFARSLLLRGDNETRRSKIAKQLVKVAAVCITARNFSTAASIISSMASPVCIRIPAIRHQLEKAPATFAILCNPSDNFREYRKLAYEDATAPILPLMSVLLQDVLSALASSGADLARTDASLQCLEPVRDVLSRLARWKAFAPIPAPKGQSEALMHDVPPHWADELFQSPLPLRGIGDDQTALARSLQLLPPSLLDAFRFAPPSPPALWIAAADKFNLKPAVGLEFALESGLISQLSPALVARFLRQAPGLDLAQIGEYIGKANAQPTLQAFAQSFDFAGKGIVDALRVFFASFRMPGEAQIVDRTMQAFAEVFFTQNPKCGLKKSDSVFILCFSIVMLNTDLHNPNIKSDKKMSFEGFKKNNGGIDDGGDIPEQMLRDIYEDILEQEMKLNAGARSRGDPDAFST